jgi:hypothetical protein
VEVFLTTPAKTLGSKPDFFIASLLTGLGGVFTYEMNERLRLLADVAETDDVVITFLRKVAQTPSPHPPLPPTFLLKYLYTVIFVFTSLYSLPFLGLPFQSSLRDS